MTDLDMLSPRELEVLRLFTIEALTHQQIAQKLGVSRRTINTHITHVTSKLERSGFAGLCQAYLFSFPPEPVEIQDIRERMAQSFQVFTKRELQTLALLSDGLSSKQIASRLQKSKNGHRLSIRTVEAYRRSIIAKYGRPINHVIREFIICRMFSCTDTMGEQIKP